MTDQRTHPGMEAARSLLLHHSKLVVDIPASSDAVAVSSDAGSFWVRALSDDCLPELCSEPGMTTYCRGDPLPRHFPPSDVRKQQLYSGQVWEKDGHRMTLLAVDLVEVVLMYLLVMITPPNSYHNECVGLQWKLDGTYLWSYFDILKKIVVEGWFEEDRRLATLTGRCGLDPFWLAEEEKERMVIDD